MTYDLIIVGNGIAAWTCLFELHSNKFAGSILHIAADEFLPPCSLNTTSVVSLMGIKKGITGLGDILVDSYDSFVNFYNTHNPTGIAPVKHYILESGDEDKLEDRFGTLVNISEIKELGHQFLSLQKGLILDSYIISPILLKGWLEEQYSTLNITKLSEVVSDYDDTNVFTFEKNSYCYKNLIFCCNAYSKTHNEKLSKVKDIKKSKPVSGTYLELQNSDLSTDSFIITCRGENLIHRHIDRISLIGGTTEKDFFLYKNISEIKEFYNLYQNIFKTLPDFSKWSIKNGMRHKGVKRLPYCESVGDNVFAMNSLYRNGFSYSVHLAKKVIQKIIQK